MRLRITHETVYRFERPASYAIQTLRLMPRGSGQQFVADWRIDVSQDCRLAPVEDHFGNLTHAFSVDGPIDELSIVASGIVLTEETAGMLRGVPERLPLSLFLRDTPLTKPDAAIRALAEGAERETAGDRLATLHGLMKTLHRRMRFERGASEPSPPAAEAFAAGRGGAEDLAHVFVAAARSLGIPARTVGGYLWRADGGNTRAGGHAWAEAHAGALGWIGFDATNDLCPTEAYVRTACGLDALDAAPIRGTRYGGSGEATSVKVTVERLSDF